MTDEDKKLLLTVAVHHDAMLEALKLGVAARIAQAEYFKTRSREALIASKAAEAAFDKAARAIITKVEAS